MIDCYIVALRIGKVAFLAFFFWEITNPDIHKNIGILIKADSFELETFFVLQIIVFGTDSLSKILMIVHGNSCGGVLCPQLVDFDSDRHTVCINIRNRFVGKLARLTLRLFDDIIFSDSIFLVTVRWLGALSREGGWRHSRARSWRRSWAHSWSRRWRNGWPGCWGDSWRYSWPGSRRYGRSSSWRHSWRNGRSSSRRNSWPGSWRHSRRNSWSSSRRNSWSSSW